MSFPLSESKYNLKAKLTVLLVATTAFASIYVAQAQGLASSEDANAVVEPEQIAAPVVVEESKVVLDQAVELKNDIIAELDRVREEKRIEEENKAKLFDSLVQSSLSSGFANYPLTTVTGLTGDQLELFLVNTSLSGLGEAYAEAEREYGVSSLGLIGISAEESGWGTSPMAENKNNIFGYKAYDSNVQAAEKFDTKRDSILTVARHLAVNYLAPDGKYHKGVTLASVNVYYASNEEWATNIENILNRMMRKVGNQ